MSEELPNCGFYTWMEGLKIQMGLKLDLPNVWKGLISDSFSSFSFKKEILKSGKAWWGPSAFQKFLWHLRGGEHPQNALKRNLGGSLQTRKGEELSYWWRFANLEWYMVIVYKRREEMRVSWMSVRRGTKGRNYHIG
jgi:hypothetical protein